MNNVTKITCCALAFTATAIATAVSTQAQAAVGRTQGTHSVSPTGAATYQIPLWISPGAGGVQPALTLSYDSRGGSGIAGPGWALTGLSSIVRCNRTVAQDLVPASVTMTYADAFCLDGQRLMLTSSGGLSTYGQPGTTYDTELSTFSLVTAQGASGNGPQSFEVKAKNGWVYEFGNTPDSRVTPASSIATAYMWLVNKVRDRAGNSYVVTYGTGAAGSAGVAVPVSISYSPATAAGSTYINSVSFEYGPKASQVSGTTDPATVGYVDGVQVTNTNLLLGVKAYSNGTLIRRYAVGYEAAPTTTRARLSAVTECASSDNSDCLAPTIITYHNGASGVAGPTTLTLANHSIAGRADVNGDGKDDLILAEIDTDGFTVLNVRVAFATAAGFGSPVIMHAGRARDIDIGDFVGNGVHDVVVIDSAKQYIRYRWDGSQFIASSLSFPTGNYSEYLTIADSTGDGRDDLLWSYQTSKTGGSGTSLYVSNAGSPTNVNFLAPIAFVGGGSGSMSTPNEPRDFDGDGRQDTLSGWTVMTNNSIRSYLSMVLSRTSYTQGGFTKELSGLGRIIGDARINDDACTDIIAEAAIFLSPCNGQEPVTVSLPGNALGAMDWNSDGRADLLVENGTNIGVLLSMGNGFAPVLPTSIPVSTQNRLNVVVLDVDGDGQHDLVTWDQAGIYLYKHASPQMPPDLLASVTDGFGANATFAYASNANRTDPTTVASYPERDYRGPLMMVSSVTTTSGATDGSAATNTRSFTYYGPRIDVTGRGFLGFSQLRITDSRNTLVRDIYMRTGFPFAGRVYRDDVQQSSTGPLVSHTAFGLTTQYLDATATNRRIFVYTTTSRHELYEVGGPLNGAAVKVTTQSTSYDDFGNATSTTTIVADSQTGSPQYGQQWSSTVTHTISPDISNWCLGQPSQTTVTNTAPGVPSQTRTTSFAVDYPMCRVTQQTEEPGDARWQVSTGYGFDGFGNINSVTVTPIGQPARTGTVSWSTYAGRFPNSTSQQVTSSTTHTTTFSWDAARGLRTGITDPNGLQTARTYDSFGRLIRETRPDGTRTAYSLTACDSSNSYCGSPTLRVSLVTTLRDPSDNVLRTDYEYADLFDRPQKSLVQLLGGAYSEVTRTYDSFARVNTESFPRPSGETAPVTSYSYDLVGRIERIRRPTSASDSSNHDTVFEYLGLSATQTDGLNRETTRRMNAASLIAQTIDAAGSDTDYEYDAFGNLLKTRDVLGNEIVMTYNVRGMKMTSNDPDMGAWQYDYFPTGELKSRTDAKSQPVSYTYDYVGRPLTRVEPEGTTTWTWGTSAASRNIGQLASIAGPGYSETYTYDQQGRLSNRSIVSDTTYNYTYTYDTATGSLGTVEYPVSTSSYRFKLQYAYQNGALNQIRDANGSTVFWQANAVNAFGQITRETMGNGVVTNRSYDLVTGRLSSIQSGVGGGAGLQNESYLFDKIGNLIQRQQNQLGLTENFYYDSLYRLDYSTLNGTTNLDLAYDALGNITSRSDVAAGATWTYHATKKHAVVQAGPNTYSYDANGNAQTRNGQNITWTSYNYPSVINGPGKTLTFNYGPDRQRYRQVYTNGSLTETTMYVGDALEKVTIGSVTDYRHYIHGIGGTVAIVSRRSDGTNTTRYMLEDHLGSPARILNSDGTALVRESFDAFGGRRDADTWSGPCPCPALTTIASVSRQGFTGHEMIGGHSMGLIHMNGRVYDSQIGRFLSADPYVQSPLMSQSLNRYSYSMNNPLSYTDPSGFWSLDSLFDGFDWFNITNWLRYWTDDDDDRPNCFRVQCNPPPVIDPENGRPWYPTVHRDPPVTNENGSLGHIGGSAPPPPRQPQVTESRVISWNGGLLSAAAQPSGELRGDAAAHGVRHRGRTTPDTRRSTVETAAEWLRSQGIITFYPNYADRYKYVIKNPAGDRIADCGDDPNCGGNSPVGGVTTGRGEVTIYRAGVEPEGWSKDFMISGPEIIDPQRQKWGETYSPNPQDPLEAAIFVLGHEDWHVRHPPSGPSSGENDLDEWNANNSGKRALERWRNRKRP
ncbi:toxin TcdB middle/N-terminal domain-containing protein [Steroidobacter flavus]|uniref:Toxin TcdB middle/N-terminal domain-containing protein n=1 Tax=Steroidobacter flavus TaxID=1842136 RepID=A0ABV8T2K1_9GAMM